MTYRTRFAPSPTGYLHPGHAFSVLTAAAAARDAGGECLLRIEDIDATRCRPAYEAGLYQDLRWLGISWPEPVLRQSEHLADYEAALETLKARGLVYACYRTRKELAQAAQGAPQAGDPILSDDGEPAAREPAWRLSLEAAREQLGADWDRLRFSETGSGPDGETGWQTARPEMNGDVVLGRKDIGIAYHLAVVIDDARQGITHIHRGHDLFAATHTQVLLQHLLGLPTPVYCHHALLLDSDGRRLAKRKGSKALRDYRADGWTAADVRAMIAASAKA
ncbi:tRNA glutamyl-Q(34) synthetase GluQRS [Asticcacaulis sp. BYS171W]|uniref:tRNA glutamyl-Q(34) synthetase GluQRS n=1 Tax=Asticcacaulis aquaticus TaxID=2984212 RepID=A0ABT5HV28_9CAUL|nr:tRNA glutamyl-Q(34) synthetase GluQRS [Asticcacaulis aquaticus]MDC7683937.1 tRNA glutamyl-Q(34) synthetase GluQRS [Asticcacaulis aquaticus]